MIKSWREDSGLVAVLWCRKAVRDVTAIYGVLWAQKDPSYRRAHNKQTTGFVFLQHFKCKKLVKNQQSHHLQPHQPQDLSFFSAVRHGSADPLHRRVGSDRSLRSVSSERSLSSSP